MDRDRVHFPPGLADFFEEMTSRNGPLLVLRGYNYLPYGYCNDIDLFVSPGRVHDFVKSIEMLRSVNCSYAVEVCRLGLIKGILHLNGERVPLDIIFQIGYCGLEYQDYHSLYLNSGFHKTKKFKIPSLSDEVRISILKELLHNKRARADKSTYLIEALSNPLCNASSTIIDSECLDLFYRKLIHNEFEMPKLGSLVRRRLFFEGFTKRPIFSAFGILIFFYVKYILKKNMLRSGVVRSYARSFLQFCSFCWVL